MIIKKYKMVYHPNQVVRVVRKSKKRIDLITLDGILERGGKRELVKKIAEKTDNS